MLLAPARVQRVTKRGADGVLCALFAFLPHTFLYGGRYRDFVTRFVCCYSTETASQPGDDAAREQELAELLPPAEGGGDDYGDGGYGRSAPRREGAWRHDVSSDEEYVHDYEHDYETSDDERSAAHEQPQSSAGGSGVLMQPVTPPPHEAAGGVAVGGVAALGESPVRMPRIITRVQVPLVLVALSRSDASDVLCRLRRRLSCAD